MATRKKKQNLTVFCLDVGVNMNSCPENSKTSYFDMSKEVLSMLIQRRMFASQNDEFAMILYGTDKTENSLSENLNGYNNITLVYSPSVYSLKPLKTIESIEKVSESTADLLDVITVALDVVHNENKKGKTFSVVRILLISNLKAPVDSDGLEDIVGMFQQNDIELVIISEDFERCHKIGLLENNSQLELDETNKILKSKNQIENEKCFLNFSKLGVTTACYSFKQACRAASGFEKRVVNSAAWKTDLSIGKNFKIPIVAYAKTKLLKQQQSWKKIHSDTHKREDIKQMINYVIHDDKDIVVDNGSIGKAYTYGSDLIPFGLDDELQSRYLSEKKLEVLAFTKSHNVPPYLHNGDQAHVVMGVDECSRQAIAALSIALSEENMCAICNYVYRRNCNPKVVALFSRVKLSRYAVLVMVALPFSENVKNLSLPSLDNVKTSREQDDLMDKIIDEMSLVKFNKEKEIDEVFYHPRNSINPYFQRMYQCMAHRMINKQSTSLPDLNEQVRSILQLSIKLDDDLDEKLKELFSTKCIMKANKVDTRSNVQWKNILEDSSVQKIDKSLQKTSEVARIDSVKVEKIRSHSAKKDFLCLLEQANGARLSTDKVFDDMILCIKQMMKEDLLLKFSFKIVQCLNIVIEKAILHSQVKKVNCFLQQTKIEMLENENMHEEWKNIFVKNGICLLSSEKHPDGADASKCKQFISTTLDQEEENIEEDFYNDEDCIDDLLSMID